MLADDAPLEVDNHRLPTKRVDRQVRVLLEEVRGQVGRDDIEVVVERPRAVLDLEKIVAGVRMRIGGAVHDFGAVQRQTAGVLGI